MPSGNKPLPEAMLTQIFVAMASQGYNELTDNKPALVKVMAPSKQQATS